MERRAFVKSCCISAASTSAMAGILSSCSTLYYANATKSGNSYAIAKSEFFYLKKEEIKERSFVLIQNEKLGFPISVYKTPEGKVASLLKCTHRGCELNVGGGIYACPCHGSEFNTSGNVLEGPAEENLRTFPITEDDENIYVQVN